MGERQSEQIPLIVDRRSSVLRERGEQRREALRAEQEGGQQAGRGDAQDGGWAQEGGQAQRGSRARHQAGCPWERMPCMVMRPLRVPSAATTEAELTPRHTSSDRTSRNEADPLTSGPSDSPGSAASAAVVNDSSFIARSATPVIRATSGSDGWVSSTAGRPYCNTLPSLITATRSPSRKASSMSCVTSTIVVPKWCWMSSRSSCAFV